MTASGVGDVVFAVSDGVMLLDLAGPMQVFNDAGAYRVSVASPDGEPVRADVGITLSVDFALATHRDPIDTLVVPGYPRETFGSITPGLVGTLRHVAPRARRVVSVCTGAFLLAEVGLLDGRRATTHWEACAALAARFPAITVDPDAIYVRDGSIVTSAGATAGIDLALALVGEDHGEDRARAVAKHLVVFLQRPGGQSQFSAPVGVAARNATVRHALDLVTANPSGDHRLTTMADHLAVSERHLTRLFRRELGSTPGQVVERLRVRTAQELLETEDLATPDIAKASGFRSPETMRQAFQRVLGVSPSAYRNRFRLTAQRPTPDHRTPGA